jgi:hypothetical protein
LTSAQTGNYSLSEGRIKLDHPGLRNTQPAYKTGLLHNQRRISLKSVYYGQSRSSKWTRTFHV